MIAKELGTLQEKILYFLAENPNHHKQEIQKGCSPSHYGSVLKAVNSLEKLGYIDSEKRDSLKNVPIKFYFCTEMGIFYALLRNSDADMIKVFDNYKEKYKNFEFFRLEYDRMGRRTFIRFFKRLLKFLPLVEKENAIFHIILELSSELEGLSLRKRKAMIKDVLKYFPEYKPKIEEMKKRINELLST